MRSNVSRLGGKEFPEQNLATPTNFRSPAAQIVGVTQTMVDNPNSVLQAAIAGQQILSTTTLQISTQPASPIVGGGTANTAFLAGAADGPNAVSALVTATFWIEIVKGTPDFLQLQYSQLVLLNFNTFSSSHTSSRRMFGTFFRRQSLRAAIRFVSALNRRSAAWCNTAKPGTL